MRTPFERGGAVKASLDARVGAAVARLVTRRARPILVAAAGLLLLAGWRIAQLRLDTDFAELLPANAPEVAVLREMNRRVPSLSALDVVVEGPDPAANRRYVDALVGRLRALDSPVVDDIAATVHDEQRFFDHNKLLYASLDDLEGARDRIARTIAAHKNPLLVDLEDDGDSLASIQSSLEGRRGEDPFARYPDGYFATRDGRVYVVVLWLRTSVFGKDPAEQLAASVRRVAGGLVQELGNRGQSATVTGTIITAAEERHALASDVGIATSISVVLVCLVVFLYFGRVGAVPLMVIPALFGVACAMAFAQLLFGYLNTITSFLGAIILGNGINYAIVQMARYEEERRRGHDVGRAIEIAIATTWRATGIAALGAAVAYGSLAVTAFRGFNQFGYIGGVGMLLTWPATLLVLPSLWTIFDRRPAHATQPRVRGFEAARPLARFTLRHSGALLAGALVLSLAALVPLRGYLHDPFEYDFDKLRNQVFKRADERVSGKLDPIFGRSLSPSVVLADRPSQVAEIERAMLERDRSRHVLGEVKTIDDALPGSPDEQARKLVVLGEIRRLLDRNLDLLDGDDRARVAKLRPPDDLGVLAPTSLPRGVRRFFTEVDGTVGRILVYFPREDVNVWDGRIMRKLSEDVRDLTLGDGSRVRTSGQAVIFAAMIDAVIHDGPIATALSFFAVLALVVLVTRWRGAWLIVGSLCLGVLWMVGGIAAAGVRINFLNFIALPITFGIASDYAVNLYVRCHLEGEARLEHAVATTGGAVALCSMTTIVGYGSLLAADTEGLRTFGAAAILGELACISTAIVVLPALLDRLRRWRTIPSPPAAEAETI